VQGDTLLSQLIAQSGRTPKPSDSTNDLAQYLLTHSVGGAAAAGAGTGKQGSKTEKRGLLSTIFDSLASPGYAVSDIVGNVIQDAKDGDLTPWGVLKHQAEAIGGLATRNLDNTLDIAGQISGINQIFPDNPIQQLSDKSGEIADAIAPRKSMQNILHDQFGVDNKFARYGGGFLLDVVTDPLNLIPGVAAAKPAEAALNLAKSRGNFLLQRL